MNRITALHSVKLMTLLVFGIPVSIAGQSELYRLPAGTHLHLKVDVELSSKVANVDDTFLATVSKPVRVNDSLVLPEGTVVEGRVTSVSPAGSFGRSGDLKIVFETLKVFGGTRRIDGYLYRELEPHRPFFLLACFSKGHEARLKREQEFEIELKKDVTLPVTAF